MTPKQLSQVLDYPKLTKYVQKLDNLMMEAIAESPNSALVSPALRIAESGGKRLRASLVIAIAASNHAKINQTVLNSAAAIELIHVASLVHDDIMDEAELRRSKPTINSQEGTARALLVGDYLLSLAYARAAMAGPQVVAILAKTFGDMCDGQAVETTGRYNLRRSKTEYLDVITKKSAGLISASCQIGAMMAGYNKTKVNALAKFGLNLGISYQLADDLLDFIGSTDELGKPIGIDVKQGIYSLPIIELVKKLGEAQVDKLINLPGLDLTKALSEHGVIAETMIEIKKYNRSAVKYLGSLDGQIISRLKDLPNQLLLSAGLSDD